MAAYFIDHLGKFTTNTPQAVLSVVTPGAFAALGIPLKRGRDFNAGDTYDAPFTVVINEALARKSFPGQDPLGRYDLLRARLADKPMKIVGVVGDVRQYGPAVEPAPEIIMPYEQHPQTFHRTQHRGARFVRGQRRYGGRSSARCARSRRRFR